MRGLPGLFPSRVGSTALIGALLLGVFVGVLVPGQEWLPGRRVLVGIAGGIAGFFSGTAAGSNWAPGP